MPADPGRPEVLCTYLDGEQGGRLAAAVLLGPPGARAVTSAAAPVAALESSCSGFWLPPQPLGRLGRSAVACAAACRRAPGRHRVSLMLCMCAGVVRGGFCQAKMGRSAHTGGLLLD